MICCRYDPTACWASGCSSLQRACLLPSTAPAHNVQRGSPQPWASACRGVLGDRRLSQKWGGSVLDSVVGTFCTQNVTDALSSKAFMNLAARFPSASSKQAALVASVQEPTAEQTCGDQVAGE